MNVIIEDGMGVAVFGEETVGVGHSEILKVEKRMGVIFADKLHKSVTGVSRLLDGDGAVHLLVDELVIVFASNALVTPTLRPSMRTVSEKPGYNLRHIVYPLVILCCQFRHQG